MDRWFVTPRNAATNALLDRVVGASSLARVMKAIE
jgi:hypothetical protein